METARTQTKTTPICQSCQCEKGAHTTRIKSSTSQSCAGENSAQANKNNSSNSRSCRRGNQTKSPRPVHGRRCQGSNSKKASCTGNVIRVATAARLPTRQTMSKWQRQTRGPKTAMTGRTQPEGRQDRKYTRTGRTPGPEGHDRKDVTTGRPRPEVRQDRTGPDRTDASLSLIHI